MASFLLVRKKSRHTSVGSVYKSGEVIFYSSHFYKYKLRLINNIIKNVSHLVNWRKVLKINSVERSNPKFCFLSGKMLLKG